MTTTTITAFDQTLQKTMSWIHEIQAELGWEDPQRAYHVLRAVLHALRDRLTADEAVHLGAQLPMLIRGAYYEGWKLSAGPSFDRTKEQFLHHVARELRGDPHWDYEAIVRAVFSTLDKHITEGEIEDVKSNLPAHIRELW